MEQIDHKLYFFRGTVILIHLAYVALFFGILYIDEKYIRNLSILVQFGVCLFLIYRFSPLRKITEITKLDRSIIFYCATFLLLNVVAIQIYNSFVTPLYKLYIDTV
jgi:hypothetical protein